MRFELFIAKRYLVKGRKNAFISIISLASIIGIAIGVAALIIAMSLFNGFRNDIRDKILSSTAHMVIRGSDDGFGDFEILIETIKRNEKSIVNASPVVFGTVLIKGPGKNASGAVLRGVNLHAQKTRNDWQNKIDSGQLPGQQNDIIIGNEMASQLGVIDGDSVTVIAPQLTLSPFGLIPRPKRFRVSGIFHSGLYELDRTTVVSAIATSQKLFKLDNRISYIQIFIKDIFQAEALVPRLKKMIPPYLSVLTWKDMNAALYSTLKLEKTVLFFTLCLIIVVAALNIIAGLILLVIQKIRDIGILLSTGATPQTIRKIFFVQGSIIGIVGTLAGVVLGLIFCFLANRLELIKVPPQFYQMSYVPFTTSATDVILVILVTLFISFTATLIPSRRAAKVNVIEAVKNE